MRLGQHTLPRACLAVLALAASLIFGLLSGYIFKHFFRARYQLCRASPTPHLVRVLNVTKETGGEELLLLCDWGQDPHEDACVRCAQDPTGLRHLVVQPMMLLEDGRHLYRFQLVFSNELSEATSVHLHGTHKSVPNGLDGVSYITEPPISPGQEREYDFEVKSYGGFLWAHGHYGLHAALGLWLPVLLQHPRDDLQSYGNPLDVVLMAEDRFSHPYCAYSPFLWPEKCDHIPVEAHTSVDYNLNKRHEVLYVNVAEGQWVRFRCGNAGTEAIWVFNFSSFGEVEVLALDGQDLERHESYTKTRTLSSAQRDDVLVRIPGSACYPILVYAGSHRGPVTDPQLRVIYLNADPNTSAVCPRVTPPASTLPYLHFDWLTPARHPMPDREPNRFLVFNQSAGDQFAGFCVNCPYVNTTEFYLCREYKGNIPPYRAWMNGSGYVVHTRRPCQNCEKLPRFNWTGITRDLPLHRCWEWYDMDTQQCASFRPVQLAYPQPASLQSLRLPALLVCEGDRVQLVVDNANGIEPNEGHPIHIHGHIFELRKVEEYKNGNWVPVLQAKRSGPHDTIWVPWMSKVTIEFEADNPGSWLVHCHNDFHLFNGMATQLQYLARSDPRCMKDK